MDIGFIVPLLALFTLLAVAVLGVMGKFEIERKRNDPEDPKSSLASDGPATNSK